MTSPAIGGVRQSGRATRLRVAVPSRPFWQDALHILAVFNVVIAHTLLERAGQNVWFFVAERASTWDIIAFALLLCAVIPGILVAVEGIAELFDPRIRNLLHAVLMTAVLSAGVFIFIVVREGGAIDVAAMGRSALLPGVIALLLGGVAALLYFRFEAAQLFVTFLAIGVLAVPGNFLIRSGASKLVFPDGSPSVAVSEVRADTPVVMVVFDELPLVSLLNEDHEIDANRYPGFAALAEDSHWFRNATGISDASNYAIPAMLSGVYPEIGMLPTRYDYTHNLFTMLGGSYEMRVIEPVSLLCPVQMCGDTSPGQRDAFGMWRGAIREPHIPKPILSPDRSRDLSDYAATIEHRDGPIMYFFHSMLPHSPWVHLPSGKRYTENLVPIGLQVDHTWTDDDWLTTQNYQRHLLQVEFTDRLLAEFLARIKEVGLYDDALIVVAADHGISFRPGEHSRFISEDNVEYITPVPLMIKQPRQTEGVIDDRRVELIDILPTIADVLEIDLDWDLDGHSLFDDSRPEPSDRVVFDYTTGDRIFLEPSAERIEAAVAEKVRIFGTGDDPDAIFEIGRYPELIGEEFDQLSIAGTSEVEISLDDESRFEDVDPRGEFIPAFITGEVRSHGREEPADLAIVVNGTIRAVTRTYLEYDRVKFAAMVPEQSFRQGRNEVDIMVISGPAESPDVWRTND